MSPSALEAEILIEDLMRDVANSLVQHGVVVGRQTIGNDHSWRSFDCRGERGDELWVGVWTRATLHHGGSRLWCQVYARAFGGMGAQRLLGAGVKLYPADSVPPGGSRGSLVPLEIVLGLDHDGQVEQVAEKILRIRRIAAGQSGGAEAAGR